MAPNDLEDLNPFKQTILAWLIRKKFSNRLLGDSHYGAQERERERWCPRFQGLSLHGGSNLITLLTITYRASTHESQVPRTHSSDRIALITSTNDEPRGPLAIKVKWIL